MSLSEREDIFSKLTRARLNSCSPELLGEPQVHVVLCLPGKRGAGFFRGQRGTPSALSHLHLVFVPVALLSFSRGARCFLLLPGDCSG